MKKNLFYIEVTDVYGEEANYSWVTRHVISASTMRGAVNKFSRNSGIRWHCTMNCGDLIRYDSKSGATCFFIEYYDEELHSDFSFNTDER